MLKYCVELIAALYMFPADREAAAEKKFETKDRFSEHDKGIRAQIETDEQPAFCVSPVFEHAFVELLRKNGNRQPLWVEAHLNRFAFERVHDIGNMDLPRALDITRIA